MEGWVDDVDVEQKRDELWSIGSYRRRTHHHAHVARLHVNLGYHKQVVIDRTTLT